TSTHTCASGRVSSKRDTTRRPINPVPPVTTYRMQPWWPQVATHVNRDLYRYLGMAQPEKFRMPSHSTRFQPAAGLPVITTRPMFGRGWLVSRLSLAFLVFI